MLERVAGISKQKNVRETSSNMPATRSNIVEPKHVI